MNKKELGAFYTTEVDEILKGFEHYVKDKKVTDLYCGDRHLLDWADKHGARSTFGYDISKEAKADIVKDTIMNPPKSSNFTLINPPYLLSNKTDNKEPFIKWQTTDLYKAALLSLIDMKVSEGIIIVPANIFVDSDNKFREKFYSNFEISNVVLFDKAVFDDTPVRVTCFYFKRGKTTNLLGHTLYNTKVGYDWLKTLEPVKANVRRLLIGETPNSELTIRTTDTGTEGGKIKLYLDAEHFYGKQTDRNKATIVLDKELSLDAQKKIVFIFNDFLNTNRHKYNSMFLTNFLAGKDGVERKRIQFRDVYKLITKIIKEENL